MVIQKSTREGFGLTVTEAIWKGRPLIGGAVGGIPLQVSDGETGLPGLERRGVRSAVAGDPAPTRASGKRLGRAGKEAVRKQFLMPRLLRDWLALFEQLEA